MRKIPAFLLFAFALFAVPIHAKTAELASQNFDGCAENRAAQVPTQLLSSDWWYCWAQPNTSARQGFDVAAEDGNVLKIPYNTAAANRGRTVVSPPLSGNIGKVTFRMKLVAKGNSTPADARISVFLGSSTGYSDDTDWPEAVGVATDVFTPVTMTLGADAAGAWTNLTCEINTVVPASNPLRVVIGRMEYDYENKSGYDVYIDDIVIHEMAPTMLEASPLTTTEGLDWAYSGISGQNNSIHPEIAFTEIGAVENPAVTLYYRFTGQTNWTSRAMQKDGDVWHVVSEDITVGAQSGIQLFLHADASYTSDGEPKTCAMTYTADNPLALDIVPRHITPGHTNLVVAGAFEAPMNLSSNGVWVGGYEHEGGLLGDTYQFSFGDGGAYGYNASIPWEYARGLVSGASCPAPASLNRDVVFRFQEFDGIGGSAIYAAYQSFENWDVTQSNGWSIASGANSDAAVVPDMGVGGGAALLLRAGERLVLDKADAVGVGEIGFWFRRAGDATNAVVKVFRQLENAAAMETIPLTTVVGLETDRYAFQRFVLTSDTMETARLAFAADTDVYLDGVYASDCSAVKIESVELTPQTIAPGDSITNTVTLRLTGGGTVRDGSLKLNWGQGTSANAAAANSETLQSASADGSVWTVVLSEAIESAAAGDFYYYISGVANDYKGDKIADLVSATNCVAVKPYSDVEGVTIEDGTVSTAMALAADHLWKGAVPKPANNLPDGATYWFLDSAGVKRGDSAASDIPADGDLTVDEELALTSPINSALAFEYDEAAQTYDIQLADYDPMRSAAAATPLWTRTGNPQVVTNFDGCLRYGANGGFTTHAREGVGEIQFWAARAGSAPVTYTVYTSTSDTGNVNTRLATGTVSCEKSLRFFSVVVGSPSVQRVRVEFNNPVYVRDAVVTASGSFVTLSNARISTNGVDYAAASATGDPLIAYGGRPWMAVDIAAGNGARDVECYVEATTAEISGGVIATNGLEVFRVPMDLKSHTGDDYSFEVEMPALTAGVTAYRFVSEFQGKNPSPTTYPETGWYAYTTDDALEAMREPDIFGAAHVGSIVTVNRSGWNFRRTYMDGSEVYSVGFTPTEETSILRSNNAFDGIGRIYFRAYSVNPYGSHELAVQTAPGQNGPWTTLNNVSIPGSGGVSGTGAYSQFCIEVNDYGNDPENPGPKFIRFIRTTPGIDEDDYIYLRDLVVTPPAANMEAFIPSIIHPGYPSKNDDITFSLSVDSIYEEYPAINPTVTLHWRRVFGSVPQPWNLTEMTSTNDTDFAATLPHMDPGRLEYYAEVAFQGASYRYTYPALGEGKQLYFYYAGDDAYLNEDPRDGNESCTPLWVYSKDALPEEFAIATATRSLEEPTPYENVYLWFKVRAFESQHDHIQIVYTDEKEPVAEGDSPAVHTNALQLIGDNLWLTTMSVTNDIILKLAFEGVAPYLGDDTDAYGAESDFWRDDSQVTTNPPLASVAGVGEETPVVIDLETDSDLTMMVRFDGNTGAYQVRRAAYQNFNDWGADTQYFEDSLGLYDVETYSAAFDGSPDYLVTTMNELDVPFTVDTLGNYSYTDYYSRTYGWLLHTGEILQERERRVASDPAGNVAARISSGGGYLQNAGTNSGAITNGLAYVKLRTRATFGGDGHTPYYKSGFVWQNYHLYVSNVTVTAKSSGHPYIQVMAAYQGPDDYIALRLTQETYEDANKNLLPRVRETLIKSVNGTTNVLASSYIPKNLTAAANITDPKNGAQIELSTADWVFDIDMTTEGSVRARAFTLGTSATSTNAWLSGVGVVTEGTVSCDTFDALAYYRNFYVVQQGASTLLEPLDGKWYLGGHPLGNPDQAAKRWGIGKPNAGSDGVYRPVPTLAYTIGVSRAGSDTTLPANAAFETTAKDATTLAWTETSEDVHYWGTAFVRIQPSLSDADLVVDDVAVCAWRGRSLPEDNPGDDAFWQARQAVVANYNGSRQIALTTSRANPNEAQMVVSPKIINGIGSFSFNYAVVGGTVTFAVETDDTTGTAQIGETIRASAGSSGEVYRPIRKSVSGKVRVRILPGQSDEDATLYLDNFFAKSFPPDDGRSWTAYNALIVAPTRNATVDEKQFEEDVSTQTAFLNNSVAEDTRTATGYTEHLPYIQSPVIDSGIGEIAFWYRAWNPRSAVPGKITFWVAPDKDAPDSEWHQITAADLAEPERPSGGATQSEWDDYNEKVAVWEEQKAAFQSLSCITNGDYRYFSAEICDNTNFVLRICSDTNDAQRVAIDNVIVTEPVSSSIDVIDISMFSAESNTMIPLGGEEVGFQVTLGRPRMNPTGIRVFADYYVGTNVWGIANWTQQEYYSRELQHIEDDKNPYLYRSAPGEYVPGQPVDSVVQYRIRVTYSGTFARPITSAAFENPEWYTPVDLNETYAELGYSPYYFVFSCPTSCVFINEFYPSGSATYDNREFIELIGPVNASIGGWSVDIVNAAESSEADVLRTTYVLPADAKFIASEGDASGWGFYVLGDTDETISNLVNYVFADHANANLPLPGGIRVRRSMGAYVDRVSYGGGNAEGAMTDRGYRYAGNRSGWSSSVTRREFVLDAVTEGDHDTLGWSVPTTPAYTVGRMNSDTAAELWGECPYEIAEKFISATAEALSEYFDKHLPADFLCQIELGDTTELLQITVDDDVLTIGTDFTVEPLGEDGLGITIKADSLAALDLSTNEVHTITFAMDGNGTNPTVELTVIDTTPEPSGDKSTDVSITITAMEIVDGKVRLTVAIANNDDGKTVEGWSWGVKSAATLDALPTADVVGGLTPLTDAAIENELTKEIDLGDGAAAGFYKGVLNDGE